MLQPTGHGENVAEELDGACPRLEASAHVDAVETRHDFRNAGEGCRGTEEDACGGCENAQCTCESHAGGQGGKNRTNTARCEQVSEHADPEPIQDIDGRI